MDTRPWRLALPPGTRWWEADLPEVVAAKTQQLAQLGAGGVAGSSGSSSGDAQAAAEAAYPLRAASWAALPVDLRRRGWAVQLRAAGLDFQQPVVWVLEGLFMYLSPEEAANLLRAMAGEQWEGVGSGCRPVAQQRRAPSISS